MSARLPRRPKSLVVYPSHVIGQLGSLLSTQQHRRQVLTLKQGHVAKTVLPLLTVVRGQFHGYMTHRDEPQHLRGIAEACSCQWAPGGNTVSSSSSVNAPRQTSGCTSVVVIG